MSRVYRTLSVCKILQPIARDLSHSERCRSYKWQAQLHSPLESCDIAKIKGWWEGARNIPRLVQEV